MERPRRLPEEGPALVIKLAACGASSRDHAQAGDRGGNLGQLPRIDARVYTSPMETISLNEAAQYTGLSPQTLKIQAERGRLAAVKVAGVWLTTIVDVLAYVASRRQNASDVVVICHDCGRTFATPSEAVSTTRGIGDLRKPGCPGCGSASWGIAAVPDAKVRRYGHGLSEAIDSAVDIASETGIGEAVVNDATGALVRVRVIAAQNWRVEFDVDRQGIIDRRDAERLADHVRAAIGDPTNTPEPYAVWRYVFETAGQPRNGRAHTRSEQT